MGLLQGADDGSARDAVQLRQLAVAEAAGPVADQSLAIDMQGWPAQAKTF